MKSVRLCSMFFLGYLASVAVARASTVGNGGDVVYCDDGGIPRAELLDHYEARTIWGKTIDLGQGGATANQMAIFAIERLKRYDQKRAARYESAVEAFVSESLFLRDVDLVDISDSSHTAIPIGCSIQQVAIQKEPRFPGEKRYTISQNLWDLMTEESKAGLILHEVIFHEALERGHTDSVFSRYLNAYVSSATMTSAGVKSYIRALRTGDFRFAGVVDLDGISFIADSLTFHDNGSVAQGLLAVPTIFQVDGIELKISSSHSSLVSFHPNGHIRQGLVLEPYYASFPIFGGQNLTVRGGRNWMEFHENDAIAFGVLHEAQRLRTTLGTIVDLQIGEQVRFDRNGLLVQSW